MKIFGLIEKLISGSAPEQSVNVINVIDEGQPTEDRIQVYGTNWCGDCFLAKRFLDEQGIPYNWIDIGKDKEAREFVQRVNNGMHSVPTIVFPDGSILVEPSARELAKKFDM